MVLHPIRKEAKKPSVAAGLAGAPAPEAAAAPPRTRGGRQRSSVMPKMKTHRGAAKRFKVTGTGRILRRKANRAHLLEKKPPAPAPCWPSPEGGALACRAPARPARSRFSYRSRTNSSGV
jgi:hypothetical protein